MNAKKKLAVATIEVRMTDTDGFEHVRSITLEPGEDATASVQHAMVTDALSACGNQSAAARFLGISRYALRYRLAQAEKPARVDVAQVEL